MPGLSLIENNKKTSFSIDYRRAVYNCLKILQNWRMHVVACLRKRHGVNFLLKILIIINHKCINQLCVASSVDSYATMKQYTTASLFISEILFSCSFDNSAIEFCTLSYFCHSWNAPQDHLNAILSDFISLTSYCSPEYCIFTTKVNCHSKPSPWECFWCRNKFMKYSSNDIRFLWIHRQLIQSQHRLHSRTLFNKHIEKSTFLSKLLRSATCWR